MECNRMGMFDLSMMDSPKDIRQSITDTHLRIRNYVSRAISLRKYIGQAICPIIRGSACRIVRTIRNRSHWLFHSPETGFHNRSDTIRCYESIPLPFPVRFRVRNGRNRKESDVLCNRARIPGSMDLHIRFPPSLSRCRNQCQALERICCFANSICQSRAAYSSNDFLSILNGCGFEKRNFPFVISL